MTPSLPKGFFLQRGDRLYSLSGWWRDQGAALRFNTREEAEQGIKDLGLPADVTITERPYQPMPVARPDTTDYDPFGVAAA